MTTLPIYDFQFSISNLIGNWQWAIGNSKQKGIISKQ